MMNDDAISELGYDPDTPRRDWEFNLHRDIDRYTDPDDSMSLQDLAVMRGHDAPDDDLPDDRDLGTYMNECLRGTGFSIHDDEDLHDYDEETYNEMLMDTGDI